MRLLFSALFLAMIVTRANAYIGETLEKTKANIDPAAITGDVQVNGQHRLLWKRADHIYANVTFTDLHAASFEQFSKWDHTDLSDEEIDLLLHEEPAPDKWKEVESPKGKMYVNEETNDVATVFQIEVDGGRLTHFLNISRTPEHQRAPHADRSDMD
jgi:hypothetical protein